MRFYSHRVCNLFRQLTRRQATLGEAVSDDMVLRDHFMSSLRDPILVKMLKREVQTDNSLSFVAIRDSAINWADDEGPQATATVAAVAASPSTPQDERLSRLEDLMEKLLLAQTAQASMPAARNPIIFYLKNIYAIIASLFIIKILRLCKYVCTSQV